MKRLIKKWHVVTVISCFLMIAALLHSCKNDDYKPSYDCGCDSESTRYIPDEAIQQVPIEEQKMGLLYFKHPEDIDGYFDDPEYNNRFWIFQGAKGCYNCQRHFIVCNEDILGSEFDYLKNNNVHDSIPVSFAGSLKYLCAEPVVGPADYVYFEIVLTEIEQP